MLSRSSSFAHISIHAPRKGERRFSRSSLTLSFNFNPRSPQGGATRSIGCLWPCRNNFNPRSPQGGATQAVKECLGDEEFQSTLPARGSDTRAAASTPRASRFQSTLPARGSDAACVVTAAAYPRFQSTLPARGSDRAPQHTYLFLTKFQSTLPARGSDVFAMRPVRGPTYFNPRSPQGGATAEKCICMQHFREFAEYYPLRHGDARCIAPQDCIIQAFFGAKKRCFYVRLCFALKNKGVRG